MPSGSTPRLVWVPRQPLTPSTTYEASFNTGYEGAPDHVWQFTTGQTTTPPIALEGELSAELVPGIDPILDCPQCSGACVQTGERNVTKALVRLPRVKGGFAGRTGHVWLTDDTPYDFREPRKLPPLPNEQHLVSLSSFVVFGDDGLPTQDVLITLPEESEPYRPCFAFVVSDERSEGAFAEPFCLDEAFPLSSAQPETVSDEAVTGGDSSACSFGVASSRRAYAAFALLALAALTRRRRSKIAL
jgi:MYXO-CTERM domain-containing protein